MTLRRLATMGYTILPQYLYEGSTAMKPITRSCVSAIGTALIVSAVAAIPVVAQAKGAGASVVTAAADLKWNDVAGFPGLKMAVVSGDPAKGAAHFFMKFSPGFAAPLHHHGADHYVTVTAGTLVLNIDGKDVKLPAGSYFSFSGKKPHMTKCEAGAECILFNDARGKWDVVPEGAPKAEAKKAEAKK
jgi:quercetin dioxygenase-like cupin family protein